MNPRPFIQPFRPFSFTIPYILHDYTPFPRILPNINTSKNAYFEKGDDYKLYLSLGKYTDCCLEMESSLVYDSESPDYSHISMDDEINDNPQAKVKLAAGHQAIIQNNLQTSHVCDVCNKGFTLKKTLIRHRKSHTSDEGSYACHACYGKYTTQVYVKRHFMLLHPGLPYYSPQNSYSRSGIGGFECTMCGKKYSRQGNANRHFMLIHGKLAI